MTIVQINAVGQQMSTGRTCKEFQDYVNQNTSHTCFTAFAQGVEDTFSFQIGNKFEWKCHALLSRITGKQAHFSRRGTKRLLKKLDSISPDVVILRNVHGNFLHLPMLLCYLAKKDISVFVMLDDCWYYTGKCTHYTIDRCDKWKTGCESCPRLKKDNPSWFFDQTAFLWKEKKTLFEAIPRLYVIGVSDWITNEAKQSYLRCAKGINRIYNWINLDTFSPRTDTESLRSHYQLQGKKVVLGVASGWSNAKGLDKFLSLSGQLPEAYQIVLVGKCDETASLPANITHIPPTASVDELAQLYSMADVFVTMSLEESFGKVSAEALACGTPIVCFDSTANRELVGVGCGAVVRANDMEAMLKGILQICKAGKTEFSDHCREFAAMSFDKTVLMQNYLTLLESIQNS